MVLMVDGHLSAAKSIKEYLNNNYKDIHVLKIDCIEYINKYINKVSTLAYKEMAKNAPWVWKHVYTDSQNGPLAQISTTSNKLMSHRLNHLIQKFKPDLIISTHPFSSQMCAILKKKDKIHCKLATIMTDYASHNQWLVGANYTDYFFVANENMKKELINAKINSQKIFVTGIPLSSHFLQNYDREKTFSEMNLSPNKFTILFFAGGEFGLGRNTTYTILENIINNFKDFQVIAIAGKNQKMKEQFQELVDSTNSNDRIKVLPFTNKVPEFMNIANVVITKPGGLTITESLASGLPIIIINPIPGQEEENANFIVNNNIGIWLKKDDNIKEALTNLLLDQNKLNIMHENALKVAKPNSTKNICEILYTNHLNQF